MNFFILGIESPLMIEMFIFPLRLEKKKEERRQSKCLETNFYTSISDIREKISKKTS